MTTYLVVPDDYAGWKPTGRNFALIGVAAGFISLLSWLSLHGRLGHFQPSATEDQIFLSYLVWLGTGVFCLMAMCAFGSITLTLRSCGTVSVTDEGISRAAGSHTQFLAWSDIQGFISATYGGVTLVSVPGKSDIIIPRFLDDYRACIAEIADHSIRALPPSSLRQKQKATRQKTTWKSVARSFACCFFYLLAIDSHLPHRSRIVSFCAAIVVIVWMLQEDWSKPDRVASRWIGLVAFFALILYALWRMALSW
jgi:hypothetical protein